MATEKKVVKKLLKKWVIMEPSTGQEAEGSEALKKKKSKGEGVGGGGGYASGNCHGGL